MLKRESAFYQARQVEFREKYLEKWLVIVGESLIGAYSTPKDAIEAVEDRFQMGQFMLHRPMDDGMTLEVGPMGVIRTHRPYAPKKTINAVITASNGESRTFSYVRQC
jgi:hypothetical protein